MGDATGFELLLELILYEAVSTLKLVIFNCNFQGSFDENVSLSQIILTLFFSSLLESSVPGNYHRNHWNSYCFLQSIPAYF